MPRRNTVQIWLNPMRASDLKHSVEQNKSYASCTNRLLLPFQTSCWTQRAAEHNELPNTTSCWTQRAAEHNELLNTSCRTQRAAEHNELPNTTSCRTQRAAEHNELLNTTSCWTQRAAEHNELLNTMSNILGRISAFSKQMYQDVI
jgi:uncharacterized membrane protein YqiK